jgi:hypothetical protein
MKTRLTQKQTELLGTALAFAVAWVVAACAIHAAGIGRWVLAGVLGGALLAALFIRGGK